MKKYDAIIIGSGQAGTPLAKKLGNAGWKIAIIEKEFVGGTCVNFGCTPTKAMIASAKMAFQASKSSDLGVDIENIKINFDKIFDRKNSIVKSFRNGSEKGLLANENIELIFGEAAFTGDKIISVKGHEETLTANNIIINTGAETSIPDILGLKDIDYLTSSTILNITVVPEKLLILGGSYIGLEFGQMFRRFGSEVTIIEQSPVFLNHEDDDIALDILNILTEEGIKILTGSKAEKFVKTGEDDILVTINNEEKHFTHVLVAVGRRPQIENLALAKCGVATDEKGYIKVNEKLETSREGVFALGDVKGGPAFTHVSYNDYIIVSENLLENKNSTIKDRLIPYCMFTDPQLGRIGLSEKEAKEKGLNYLVAKLPMKSVARGIETGQTKGLMKAIVDPGTKQILGAAILAEQGGEIMSILQMAMIGKITYEQIKTNIFAHPLYAESLNNLFMTLDKTND